eukprot:Pgem_evm2s15112
MKRALDKNELEIVKTIFARLEVAANEGNEQAQFQFGYLYNFGLGVDRNYKKAY